ncbi:MAG: hypothetical protein HYZ53_28230 [Planctomycetes bacterium]|nr:hypothetical protein [Planctomycetota bacterium]
MKAWSMGAAVALWVAATGSAWAQDDPKRDEEKEARKAFAKFEQDYKNTVQAERVHALQQLAFVRRDLALAALSKVLVSDTDAVRIAAADVAARIDDLSTVQMLGRAIEPNLTRREVMAAIVKALETLDWEAGAAILNSLLARDQETEVANVLEDVVPALGKIGSPTSIEPLIALLDHVEGAARLPSKNRDRRAQDLVKMKTPAGNAIAGITGWKKEKESEDWEARWRDDGPRLMAERIIVYFCKNTFRRWELSVREKVKCPHDDKAPSCVVVVKSKLHEGIAKK